MKIEFKKNVIKTSNFIKQQNKLQQYKHKRTKRWFKKHGYLDAYIEVSLDISDPKQADKIEKVLNSIDGYEPIDVFYDFIDQEPTENKLRYSFLSKYNKCYQEYQVSKYVKGKQNRTKGSRIVILSYSGLSLLFMLYDFNETEETFYLQYLEKLIHETILRVVDKNQELQNEEIKGVIQVEFKTDDDF